MSRRPATKRYLRASRAVADFSRRFCDAPFAERVTMLEACLRLIHEQEAATAAFADAWASGLESVPRIGCLRLMAELDQAMARLDQFDTPHQRTTEQHP